MAQNNKSPGGKQIKKRRTPSRQRGAISGAGQPARPVVGRAAGYFHDRIIMRVKFEAIDASGKVHKRSSAIRIYSHCVVIHFAAQSPSKFWPEGIVAFCHAEWAASWELAERNASRRRKKPDVEAIEIVEARQV